MMRQLSVKLRDGGVADASREARYIFEWATGRPFSHWVVNGGVIEAEVRVKIEEMAERRVQGEPLAYITGHREFFGLDLLTAPAALIPRPETELLVEKALRDVVKSSARVADIGCGTGAIALALRSRRPDWTIFGADISDEALQVARYNGERLHLTVNWVASDLLARVPHQLDAIVANLPYVSRDSTAISPEIRFEPPEALFAEKGGLALIERLIQESPAWLNKEGQLFLECGWDQGALVMQLLEEHGFKEMTVTRDYGGHDRVVSGRRC